MKSTIILLLSLILLSCSSTKKTINRLGEKLEQTGIVTRDTSSMSSKDSTSVTKTTTESKQSADSTYEKVTEETIIDWIVGDPVTTKPVKQRQTIRRIKETGSVKKDHEQSSQAKTETTKKSADSSNGSMASVDHAASTTTAKTVDVKRTKFLPGWAWLSGIILLVGGAGYFANIKFNWISWLIPKKKKHVTEGTSFANSDEPAGSARASKRV